MNLHVGKQKSEKKTDRGSYRRMDRKNKLARMFLWMAFLFAGVFAVPQMRVWAGDINPDELIKRVVAAGAKRCVILMPSFTIVAEDKLPVLGTKTITYGGLEDD